jgi:colicin import membrane protein
MTNTLYDVLEVSQSATQESIVAAYQRFHAKFAELSGAGNEDAANQLVAIREAYDTLSNPDRRQRYDAKLKFRAAESEQTVSSVRPAFRFALLAVIIGASCVLYSKYQSEQEMARLEQQRIAAEAKAAELAKQKEREDKQAAEAADQQRRRDEAIAQSNRERDIAHADQVSRDLQRDLARDAQQRANEERQRQFEQRQKQFQAEWQLAKEKAYLRQLQTENATPRRYSTR